MTGVDTVGCALAGMAEEATHIALKVPGVAQAPGPALIWATGRRTSALDATLINGTASHALDYDDVAGVMGGHPSAMLVPPLLALADGTDATGRDLALAYVVVGLATGALSGLLGIGGGAIMVPIMAVVFGIPSVVAKGTSLAVIIPTALMGTLRNRSKANVDLSSAVVIGITGVVMAIVGAWVSARMSDTLSNALFAVLLISVAVRMLRQAWTETARAAGS